MSDRKESASAAVVAGATGLVGRHLLDLLLADPTTSRVVTLVRRPSGATHAKLEEHVVDFDSLEDSVRVPAGARVFSALGTTIRKAGSREAFRRVDFDYVVALARAARRDDAALVSVVSSLGADSRSRNLYLRIKGETEEAVGALGLPSVQIFRPSLLLGDRGELRPGEKVAEIVSRLVPFSILGPLAVYEPVPAAAVARAMLERSRAPKPGVEVVDSKAIRAAEAG